MKRENLQRANELEKEIKSRENKLQSIRGGVYVGITRFDSGTYITQVVADNLSENPHDRDAFVFIVNVTERLQSEINALLKEMDGL